MPLEGGTAPSWWGCLCACVQLATRLPIGSFFILARMGLGVTLLSPSGGFLRFPLMHAFHSRVSKIRCLKLLLGGDLMILPSGSLGYLVEGKILDLEKNDSNVDESCNQDERCSKTKKKCLLQTHAWNVILDLFTNCPELFAGKGDKRREKY